MAYETIKVETAAPGIVVIAFNRPEVANALSTRMGQELLAVWSDLRADESLRAVILRGEGKHFQAGADLKERNGMTDEAWQKQHAIFEQAVYRMMDCPVPIIGAINGAAYGGGCEFTLACDFAYGARSARFALTEVTLGIMPGAGGTQNLPRAVGVRRAKEIILTGAAFGAEDALAWGILNKVCDDATLFEETMETARRIAGNAPVSIRQAKRAMDVATQVDLKNGFAFEIEAYNRMVPTADRQEGIRAFNEKRRPQYTGR